MTSILSLKWSEARRAAATRGVFVVVLRERGAGKSELVSHAFTFSDMLSSESILTGVTKGESSTTRCAWSCSHRSSNLALSLATICRTSALTGSCTRSSEWFHDRSMLRRHTQSMLLVISSHSILAPASLSRLRDSTSVFICTFCMSDHSQSTQSRAIWLSESTTCLAMMPLLVFARAPENAFARAVAPRAFMELSLRLRKSSR
mmetsp:Transcript_35284/g.88710  ORF Transcript_35284/g.88710 Transcript_35284/m.88710 type:complete len:204 (+) Transcript_35284:273-884(+)